MTLRKGTNSPPPLQFKFAIQDWEFELIHELNYRTFVEKIPQHSTVSSHRLIDKFHAENTYLICLLGRELVGMLAVRGQRPFSVDEKLANLDSYLPAGRSVCEIRLLAVERHFRSGKVLPGLLALLWQFVVQKGYDLAVISGTVGQEKLYRHLGFIAFGPVVGSGRALFRPMFLTLEAFEARARGFLGIAPARAVGAATVNLLPGPVAISREVRRAFDDPPESHRSDGYAHELQRTKRLLCQLVNAQNVEVLLGSGTLANDAIAGQLSLERKPGLVLSNGEFGERLVDHAHRFGLSFDVVRSAAGHSFDLSAVRQHLARSTAPAWLWCVHCETSTGVLNSLPALKTLWADKAMKLCLDCISSIGTVPVQLDGVYLASGVSGKGLRAYPGLAMVFYHHEIEPAPRTLPRYLDLGLYAKSHGIPFTQSSNLVRALQTAIKRVSWHKRFVELAEMSTWLRTRLRGLGLDIMSSEADAAPAVVTMVLPSERDAGVIGRELEQAGYLLSHNSAYLRRLNWIQICLMGECSREKLVPLLTLLERLCCGEPEPERRPELAADCHVHAST